MIDLCKGVHFDCNEKGLHVQPMCYSRAALVSLLLLVFAFAVFKCVVDATIDFCRGVNFDRSENWS